MAKKYLLRILMIVLVTALAACANENFEKGKEYQQKGDLEQAIQAYQTALSETEAGETRQAIQSALDSAKTALVSQKLQEASFAAEGSPPATIGKLNQGLDILNRYLPYDDPNHRLAAKIADYTAQLNKLNQQVAAALQESHQLFRQNQPLEALARMDQALALNPGSADLQAQRAQLLQSCRGTLAASLGQALSQRDWPEVHKFLPRLKSVAPADPQVAAAEQALAQDELNDTRAKVEEMMSSNQWYQAFVTITSSPVGEKLDDLLGRVRDQGGRYYVTKGQEFLKEGKTYRAYVAAVKAKVLLPNDREAFNLAKATEDALDQALSQYVAVAAFDAPADEPDAGKQFSDDLISYLFREFPYGIHLVERQKIDLALSEQSGDVGKAGQLLGVNLIITGNVSRLKVERQEHSYKAVAKIPVGTSTRLNPEYQVMVAKYGTDPANWPEQVPMTVEQKDYSAIPYNKGRALEAGYLNVSVRIFDVKSGSIVYANVFKLDKRFEDQFQEGVPQAEPPVADDPLVLPTETEVKTQLTDTVIKELAQVVLKLFENREKQFLERAEFYLKRREFDQAMAQLALGHYYARKGNLTTDNPQVKEINSLILKLTE
ncbi:MAG: hypothetical protein KQJ78_02290 [Deltaproteobacteria bacterium]|nr:hypothetical protein [Deltaproteobacteria bacterium]